MSNRWIERQGKRILYANFRGQKDLHVMVAGLEEMVAMLSAAAEPVLLLLNFDGMHVMPQYIAKVKELGGAVIEPKTARSAATGIRGTKRALFKAYLISFNSKMNTFETVQECLEYLAQ